MQLPLACKCSPARVCGLANALQDMVPALIDAIKSHGLALVIDRSAEAAPEFNPLSDPFPRLPKGVDGVLKSSGVLQFHESFDM